MGRYGRLSASNRLWKTPAKEHRHQRCHKGDEANQNEVSPAQYCVHLPDLLIGGDIIGFIRFNRRHQMAHATLELIDEGITWMHRYLLGSAIPTPLGHHGPAEPIIRLVVMIGGTFARTRDTKHHDLPPLRPGFGRLRLRRLSFLVHGTGLPPIAPSG
jgi:hypothetical protein